MWFLNVYCYPNENYKYGYPYSNAFLQFCPKFERCKPQKATQKCDIIDNVKLFPTVYLRNELDFWKVHGIMNTSGLL